MPAASGIAPGKVPAVDRRLLEIRHTHYPFAFQAPPTLAAWKRRREELRRQLRLALGLWPMPPRAKSKPLVTRRTLRDGYAIENVCLESLPGLHATGNLYRPHPLPKGARCPALLIPHGHWPEGRLVNRGPEGDSMPGLAINIALRGGFAFTYDMLGYNDSKALSHRFGRERVETDALWGLSLLGLQTLNSLAVLEYLLARPEVDPERVACSGASGGGTQTFVLAALDERVRACAPAVMVGSVMQGGCLCENAPGLRLGTNNLELAALAAPRPQLLISCTQDWTARTPWLEFPAVRSAYALYGARAAKRIEYYHQHAPHNYNRASREALYAWLGRLWFGQTAPACAKEIPFQAEPLGRLRVFPGKRKPKGALGEEALLEAWKAAARKATRALKPKTPRKLKVYRQAAGPLLAQVLRARTPSPGDLRVERTPFVTAAGRIVAGLSRLALSRREHGDRVTGLLLNPAGRRRGGVIAWHHGGACHLVDPVSGQPDPRLAALRARGAAVLALDVFEAPTQPGRPHGLQHDLTFNPAALCERVQDLLTVLAWLRAQGGPVALWGIAHAGAWTLLAAARAEGVARVAADLAGLGPDDEQDYRWRASAPGLLRAGGLPAAAALQAPRPLLLYGARQGFDFATPRAAYKAARKTKALEDLKKEPDAEQLAAWLVG
ncbi:MAG: hypothetical protein M5U26_02885 [Planctomycetota bacterium]|nr:hypothetical protein [Planctomycetota bacterium]